MTRWHTGADRAPSSRISPPGLGGRRGRRRLQLDLSRSRALGQPRVERFRTFPFPSEGAEVRQLLGRTDEVWGAESGTDKIVVLLTG
jgi:hypothetical protein